jgi:hypothetical protein
MNAYSWFFVSTAPGLDRSGVILACFAARLDLWKLIPLPIPWFNFGHVTDFVTLETASSSIGATLPL